MPKVAEQSELSTEFLQWVHYHTFQRYDRFKPICFDRLVPKFISDNTITVRIKSSQTPTMVTCPGCLTKLIQKHEDILAKMKQTLTALPPEVAQMPEQETGRDENEDVDYWD